MPPEIADSDDDSETQSPRRPTYSPIQREELDARPHDPILDLSFSQFLSPTQRLSSYVAEQPNTQALPSTASSDSFLRELEQPQEGYLLSTITDTTRSSGRQHISSKMKQKRRLSDIENRSSHPSEEQFQPSSTKRIKTYGGARSQQSDDHSELFPNADHKVEPTGSTRQGHVPKRPISTFFQRPLDHATASPSLSTSGYQGFNLDFRNESVSIDDNINPFGPPTQSSLQENSEHTALDPEDVQTPQVTISRQFATSSPEGMEERSEVEMSLKNGVVDIELKDESSGGKKRGLEPRSRRTGSHSSVIVVDNEFEQKPVESQMEVASNKKQKMTTTKEHRVLRHKAESSPIKNLSSELQLSEEFYDKYPKESYIPRPSRSRTKPVVENVKRNSANSGMDEPEQDFEEPELPQIVFDNVRASDKPKGKRGRKSKPKKTQVNEELDDDVAKMKEDVAVSDAELTSGDKQVKREDLLSMESKTDDKERANGSEMVFNKNLDRASTGNKISVCVPALRDSAATEKDDEQEEEEAVVSVKSVPKKRGRKPKKKVVILPTDEVDELQATDTESRNTGRNVLADKDPNLPAQSVIERHENDIDVVKGTAQQSTTEVVADDDEDTTEIKSKTKKEAMVVVADSKPTMISASTSVTSSLSSSAAAAAAASAATMTGSLSTKTSLTRIGLSRRHRIPSLLRKLDRTKEPPKMTAHKEKLTKKQKEAEEKRKLEAEDGEDGQDGDPRYSERGKDGMLIEWDF